LAERRDEVAGGAEEGGELYTGSNATSRCPSGKALTGSLLDPPDAGAATAAPPAPVSTDQRAAFRSAMLCPRRLESTWRYPDPAGCSGDDPAPGMANDGLDAGCKCGVEGEEELLAERWWCPCAPWPSPWACSACAIRLLPRTRPGLTLRLSGSPWLLWREWFSPAPAPGDDAERELELERE